MPRVTQNYAPYAPPKNVLDFIHRKRERGLPDVIGLSELQQMGIPEGNTARTLRALEFLGLIGDDGRQTALLERIGTATDSEYRKAMAEMLRSAYGAVFTIVDPAVDAESAVADAFRRYQPAAQRGRMVALFHALCREAGLIQDRPRRAGEGYGEGPISRHPSRGLRLVQTSTSLPENVSADAGRPGQDYALISALVHELPPDRHWTQKKREKWLEALAAAVDLMVEVSDQ